MSDAAAFIRLSLQEGAFEIQGSEEFVSTQAERFEDLIHELLKQDPAVFSDTGLREAEEPRTKEPGAEPDTAYPRVFSERGDGYAITAKIPGNSNAEKMANIGLLLGLANRMKGRDQVDASVVRDACEEHGCYDSGNFKAAFKTRKEYFVIEGTGQNYALKLTVPGKEQAEELAESIQTA